MNKQELFHYLDQRARDFYDLSDRIWEHPETLFEEYRSADFLCHALEQEGFAVNRGLAGIETAFSGTFGSGKPFIGILGEFDALSGLSQCAGVAEKAAETEGANGHGCGHNMLGAGSLAAAVAIKKYLETTGASGTVIYFGCPGEEGGSGKAFMARDGVFDQLDIALSWHPAYYASVWPGSSLANYQIKYRFKGVSAHAAVNPEQGRSALDALELMTTGTQYLREHVIQEARIHYAVTNTGGFSPNVVQANAEAIFLIRAPKLNQVDEIYQRLNKVAQGAAIMTETEVEVDFLKSCANILPNTVLGETMYQNLCAVHAPEYTEEEMKFIRSIAETCPQDHTSLRARMAKAPVQDREEMYAKLEKPIFDFVLPFVDTEAPVPGSTDVGDVSWVCPTAQCLMTTWAAGTPGHSWQIVSQGKSPQAHKGLLWAGKVIAATAIDLLEHPELVKQAKEEHAIRLGGRSYVSPIPKTTKPRRITDA